MLTVLIRVADLLFGTGTNPVRHGIRWPARYLALAGVLTLVLFARRPDAILRPQFWAEDGTIFFLEQLQLGFWSALGNLYAGFPFLAQRLVAALGSLAPTAFVPLVYNVSAITITALTMATFSLPGFRHLVRADGVRMAVCVACVCIPAGQELLSTPTTVGYFLVGWLVFLSVMRTPRTSAGAAAWCLGGAVSVLSGPLAPIVTPLWLLRAVRGVARRHRRDIAFAATQAAALLVVVGTTQLLGGDTTGPSAPAFQWRGENLWSALRALGWAMASCLDSFVLPIWVFERLEARGSLAVVAPALLVTGALALALRDLSARGRTTVALALYLFVSSIWLIMAGRPIIVLLLEDAVPNLHLRTFQALGTRHRALPNVAMVLAAAGVIDGARRLRVRAVAAGVTCAGLLFAWTPDFRVPPFPDLQWPVWAARLDRKLAAGSREPLVIPSHPRFFDIAIDRAPSRSPGTPPDMTSRPERPDGD
jgi:hypothetical protein